MKRFMTNLIGMCLMAFVAQAQSLQEQINLATSGSVVEVAPGSYAGPIRLKEGVHVVAMQPGTVVIETQPNQTAIYGADRAAVDGLVVRGGMYGLRNMGTFVGVFNCRFEGQRYAAAVISRGSGVFLGNEFVGQNQQNSGVVITESNPYFEANQFSSFNTAVVVSRAMVPTLVNNRFDYNRHIFQLNKEASVRITGNEIADGQALFSNRAGSEDQLIQIRTPELVGNDRSSMMDDMYTLLVSEHTKLNYQLVDPDSGTFYVITEHAQASFTVHSSRKETVIQEHAAMDVLNLAWLHSEKIVKKNKLPFVRADNPHVTEKEPDRYVLDQVYHDAASYMRLANGNLRFNRMTNVPEINIICPVGYQPVSVNYPYETEVNEAGQTVIQIIRMGKTYLDIELAPLTPSL